MKEMVGGCCVCSDDRGWAENPLVYCDGTGCTVAVHQACYGIVTVPQGNWYCRKCESVDRNSKVRCELCPNKDGALKPTDNDAWAHVVCALYIPEVRFGNVSTMEPIILAQIPQERYFKTCYLCEEGNRGSGRATVGACMQCNKAGCKVQFHVTCAQSRGLLCEEAGFMDNVKYCGYCHHHYTKIVIKKKGINVKVIPPYKPVSNNSPEHSSFKDSETVKTTTKRKMSESRTPPVVGQDESSSSSQSTNQMLPSGSMSSSAGSANTGSGLMLSGQSHNPPTSSPSVASSGNNISPPGPPESKRLFQALKDSSRPNSIVVNVPLDVLPSASQGGTISVPTSSSANSIAPTSSASFSSGANVHGMTSSNVMATTPLPQVDLSNSLLSGGSSQTSSSGPLRRRSSQSSEKTDKPRRSSKRGVAGASGAAASTAKTISSPSQPSQSSLHIQPTSNKNENLTQQHMSNHQAGANEQPAKTRRHSNSSQQQPTNHVSATHASTNHLSHQQPGGSASTTPTGQPPTLVINHGQVAAQSPSPVPQIKDEKPDFKPFPSVTNVQAPHMLGNTLNPSSTMAQKMCDTLSQEISAHSAFSIEQPSPNQLVGPTPPGRVSNASNSAASSNALFGSNSSNNWSDSNNVMPRSLEQLLERQWEQGSQFLMEQAQHFDIASLLTCLHQLRAENNTLEDQVKDLMARRDHLLAVNARLAIPLVPPATTVSGTPTTSTATSTTTMNGPGVDRHSSSIVHQSTSIVENGLPPTTGSSPQELANFRSLAIRQNNPMTVVNSAANNNFVNPTQGQNSVLVRTISADNRRSSHSPASNVYASSQMFQQQSQHSNQPQVLMRRDVIEMNQSGSSKS
ncbi:myeloid lymphoid or mixed-lineage leukemia (trithorax homolog, Drosophila) [Nesidiocoris tenuis]|nr:myeloid lymphoid or mixed-lineage leukemia (trithorax homolog, Drosophila) [Nesidiocoris tenuis]